MPMCDKNHWSFYVLNLKAKQVEYLNSLMHRKGKNPTSSKVSNMEVEEALHLYGFYTTTSIENFDHIANVP